jgi:hypothetical protein
MRAADRRARELRPTRVTPSWSNEMPWERGSGACAPDRHPGAATAAAAPLREPQTPVSRESASAPPLQPSNALRPRPRARRLSWAQLLQRVFGADALARSRCGERMRLLAVIQDPEVIQAILKCLNLPPLPPPLTPARRETSEVELDFWELPIYEN